MFPFRKILFPVDYSAPCKAAVPYVKEMVRHFSADLTLVHAYGAEALAYSPLAIDDPDLPGEARDHEQLRLHEFAMETFPGQHVEIFAELGEAGTAIDCVIKRQTTDLVMLPTHGRGPIRRLLLGSVAAKVLHDVDAAVWTCTAAVLAAHPARVHYESIVCALNDTGEAEAVLDAAAAFACAYKAQLRLVRVVQMPTSNLDVDFTPYRKDVLDAEDFAVRELKGKLGITAPHSIIDGAIAERLCEEATLREADLIVAGRGRAQDTFERMWSNLYPIVREAPCPVLSI